MCKIGLGVTFRVGNRRKPLKNFEQVKWFLFVCLFSTLWVLLKSKGEQHNAYNKNYCFRFLHDGHDYNHSVDNSAILQNPRHQVQRLSTTYQILHFQHCSVFVLSVIALLFWSCKKVFKPQDHECFGWFIASWDSGLHAADSGFVFSGTLIPNSNISGLRDSLSWISSSDAWDSCFYEQKIPGF